MRVELVEHVGHDLDVTTIHVEKISKSCPRLLLDLEKTPLGGRFRFLRKRWGMTLDDLAERTGISKPTLCQFERGRRMRTMIVAKLLAYFGQEAADAFPEGDPLEQVVPVSDFGSWLRNFRIRRGLRQAELAKAIGVCEASVSAYELNRTKPQRQVLERLRKGYGLNGEFERFL